MPMTVKWYGEKAKAAERAGAARGLYLWAEHVLEEAVRIVPLQEGTLMRSGVASVDAGQLSAAVSFSTPYAIVQHEGLDFQHPRGRQSKYLESPALASKAKGTALVAREIKRALGA